MSVCGDVTFFFVTKYLRNGNSQKLQNVKLMCFTAVTGLYLETSLVSDMGVLYDCTNAPRIARPFETFQFKSSHNPQNFVALKDGSTLAGICPTLPAAPPPTAPITPPILAPANSPTGPATTVPITAPAIGNTAVL